MTVEAKKIKTVQWILGIDDERSLDVILSTLANIEASQSPEHFSSHQKVTDRKFDLDKVILEQQYVKPTPTELTEIAAKADLKESTQELLDNLKSLDY